MTANSDFQDFASHFAVEHAATWERIFDRNHETIKIRNARLALPNLELIIGSTLRICNHASFSAMSLRDLSRESGLSMGALYSYIESKEQLLTMILEHVLYLVDTVLDAADDAGRAPRERLRALLRRHVFLTDIMQPWFFFAYMEAKSFDNRGRQMAIGSELRTQGLIAACLVAGQQAGVFQPHDPVMTASLIKPVLQDWYLKRWKYRRGSIGPDEYAGWVVRFVEAFVLQAATG